MSSFLSSISENSQNPSLCLLHKLPGTGEETTRLKGITALNMKHDQPPLGAQWFPPTRYPGFFNLYLSSPPPPILSH